MPVSKFRARTLALSLEKVSEAPHFDRVAFRTPRKIFATLGAGEMNFMFDPATQEFFCEHSPAMTAVSGGWGRAGATNCDLKRIDEATFFSALRAAHGLASAPRPKAKSKAKKPRQG